MAATATGAITWYEEYDISLAESVFDAIQIVSREDHILFTELPKRPGSAMKEEWLSESLSSPASNAHSDAETYSYTQRTPRSRLSNWHQYFNTTWRVGRIREAVDEYGVASEYAHEMDLSLREHACDIELDITYGSSASGLSSTATATASKLQGICNWITTYTASGTGSAALSVTAIDNLLERIVTNTSGKPFWGLLAPKLKRQVSSLTDRVTRNVNASEKKLPLRIDVYESDLGLIQLEMNVRLAAANDALNSTYDRALFIDRSKWSIAVLTPTDIEEVAPQGYYKQGAANTVLTLISLAESCNGMYLASSS